MTAKAGDYTPRVPPSRVPMRAALPARAEVLDVGEVGLYRACAKRASRACQSARWAALRTSHQWYRPCNCSRLVVGAEMLVRFDYVREGTVTGCRRMESREEIAPRKKQRQVPVIEFRRVCLDFAQHWLEVQVPIQAPRRCGDGQYTPR